MSEYLLSLIGIILLAAILTSILPEGKTSGLIKAVVRMACILAIISPILTFFQTSEVPVGGGKNSTFILSDAGIEIDAAFIDYYSEMRISETQNALNQEMFERFSVNCEVTLSWEKEEENVAKNTAVEVIKITKINVKMLEKQSEEVIKNMWEYLTKNYCSEVLIE